MPCIEVCHDNEFVLQKNSSLARPPLRWLRLPRLEDDMVVSSRLPGLVCLLSSYWVLVQLHWPPALDKIWKMVYLWGNSSINNKQVSVFVSCVFISFWCNHPTEVVIQKKLRGSFILAICLKELNAQLCIDICLRKFTVF